MKKGRTRRFLSSVCAVFLAFLMIGQTAMGNAVNSIAATGESAAKELFYGDGWSVKQMMTNVKLDKSVYVVGKDTKAVVTFDIRRAPQSGEENTSGSISFELCVKPTYYSYDYVTLFSKEIQIMDLKAGENKVEIPAQFASEEEEACLRIYQSNGDYPEENYIPFSIQKQSSSGDGGTVGYTGYWVAKEQMSGIKTEKSDYKTGSEQTVNVQFNVAKLPSKDSGQTTQGLHFILGTAAFNIEYYMNGAWNKDGLIVDKTITLSELKGGANTVPVKARFETKGAYYLYVVHDQLEGIMVAKVQFTVSAPTDSSGHTIDTKGSVRPQYTAYSAKQAATMKVFYSIDDSDSKYHLYIRKGIGITNYSTDQKYVVADFMTSQGDLPAELGKEMSVTLNKTENDFSYKGVYEVVLYNITKQKEVGRQKFYVIPEKYVIQRDATKMTDDGKIPFYCDADIRNMDLDKDQKFSFQVCFPIDYSKYLKQLETNYRKTDSDFEYGDSEVKEDFFEEELTDNYVVNMNVSYVPEGSKDSRKLYTKKITGLYKAHEISFTSKEIRKAIFDTTRNDIGYAGVVTVKFSNDINIEDDYQWIENEAIIRFTESFKFGVSKAEKMTSAEASPATAELEYGGYAGVAVSDTLGGNIIADVYDGNNKITSFEGKCAINSDGTASGTAYWNLQDNNGDYIKGGSYTVKVHTENSYTVFNADGTSTEKKVKSDEKTVTINVKASNRALKLSAKVSGPSGGNTAYVEQAKLSLIVKTTVGVSTTVKVTRGKGGVVTSGDFICARGEKVIFITLDKGDAKVGKYKVIVSAETMDGRKKTAKASFSVKKLPKASIKNASLKLSNGIGTVSFGVSQLADVKVVVKSGNTVKQTVVDQSYSAGDVKTTFSYGGYKPGNYKVVITTKNSGGSKTITKGFTIKKKPVVVKKPTCSALSVSYVPGKDGDMFKGVFSYTGKGAKVVIDIMYNDTEEIVYTYQGVTKYDSGKYTYTWDGYKSNGFRCWPGKYTYRVYLVNSAGSTPYLRQNFEIGEG